MDNREYYILLFDIYEELFTTKQQQYFKDYYFDDLSIGEIAGNYDVSRNAVFDQIKKVCNLLIAYEEKLNIFKTHEKLSEVLELTDLIEIKKIIKTIIKE